MSSVPFLRHLINLLGSTPIDDSIDKLSCSVSASVFIFFAIIISSKSYIGSPIECYVPQTYSGKWAEFAENYCFLKDTYWYPSTKYVTDISEDHKQDYRVTYYQWSGLYLTAGAFAFMIPKFLWKLAQKTTDMSLVYYCDTTNEIRMQNPFDRAEKVEEMGKFLRDKITAFHASYSLASVSMSVVYGFIKLLYVLVAMMQFIMLGVFLDQTDDLLWGWNLFNGLLNDKTWEDSGMFPRITFCDFRVLLLSGYSRDETIECMIVLNEFNEKIFIFLWFWLVILFFFTVIGTTQLIFRYKQVYFISNLLHTIYKPGDKLQEAIFEEFGKRYLTMDGKLIISFVKSQSDVVAQELVLFLYDNFVKEHEPQAMLNDSRMSIASNEQVEDPIDNPHPI